MNQKFYESWKKDIKSGNFNGLSAKDDLLKAYNMPFEQLVDLALAVRTKRKEDKNNADFCSSGYLPHLTNKGCEMGCSFCGFPEAIYKNGSREFISELSENAIIENAKKKKQAGATRYKIVSLGCSIRKDEYEIALKAIPRLLNEVGYERICLSFGVISENNIRELIKRFGTDEIEINHNLEVGSAEAYERLIENKRGMWETRYETVLNARKYGLNVCSGGLVGIGETKEDQADLVMTLRSLNVTSSPFNVFVLDNNDKSIVAEKIKKGKIERPTAEELLRTLCMWRLGLPKTAIASNSGYGNTGHGDFGIYSGIVELALINDKVSVPNQGFLSKRYYQKS